MWKKLRAGGLILLELCLDLLLLILFSGQAFIAGCLLTYGHIPAPTEWTNNALLEQKFDDFYIQAESFGLKLNGEIELTEPRVYHGEMDEPILEAQSTSLYYSLRKDGVFQFTPTGLVLSKGTLQMPAIYAPDGKRTAILEHVTFHLTPAKGFIKVDSFAAQHEDIRLRGSIDWPMQPTGTAPMFSIEDFYQLVATSLKEKERFSPFIEPTLEFAITARYGKSVDVAARLSCEQLKHTYATGTDFNLQTAFQIQGDTLIPQAPLLLSAKLIDIPEVSFSAETISANVAIDQWERLIDGVLPELEISANRLTTHGIELNSTQAKISPQHLPELTFSGSTSGLEGAVKFSGQLNSKTKSGAIHAHGSVEVLTLFPESALTKLPKLQFGSTPYLNLSINLGENFQLNRTTFRIDASDVTANGLTFDHILATGSYNKGLFSLDSALIDRGKQWIDATFSLNNTNKDFKISLSGSALPDQYSPLLPRWWPKIFADIDFNTETLGYGDFIIYGNAATKGSIFFLGHATATNVAYKKTHIDEGELIVRGRGKYVELHNIDAKTGNGWAKGNVGFTSGKQGLVSVRYDIDSLMPLDAASKIFGGNVATIINDFETTQLPRVTLSGVNFTNTYTQYANDDTFHLKADIRAPITFKTTPLDHLRFELHSRGQNIYLRDIHFGYADGQGQATADILSTEEADNQLRFKLNLEGANQAKAIQNLPSFDNVQAHLTHTEAEEDQQIQSVGKIDLNLHAQGPLGDIYQYHGYGDFHVDNDQIGSIQLLGPLSTLLKNTRLNFTSFNLNQMAAEFNLAQEQLNISELILEGPRTRIWADGTFQVPDQALDMYVRVNLFANIGEPDSSINSFRRLITSPLPNLLVFDLTGTIHDQKLRLSYDPRKFIPVIKDL